MGECEAVKKIFITKIFITISLLFMATGCELAEELVKTKKGIFLDEDDYLKPEITTTVPYGDSPLVVSSHVAATSKTFSAGFINPDSLSFNARWMINGVEKTMALGRNGINPLYVNPSLLGIGHHTIELELYKPEVSTTIYDSFIWILEVRPNAYPYVTSYTPSQIHTTLTVQYAQTFEATVANPFDLFYMTRWYLNGSPVGITSANNVFPLVLLPPDMGSGTYEVRLEVTDGFLTVYDSFTWTFIIATPNFSRVALSFSPSNDGNTFHARDDRRYSLNGFTLNGTNDSRGTPMYSGGASVGFASGRDFCVKLDSTGDFLSSDFSVVFYDKDDNVLSLASDDPTLAPRFTATGDDLCLSDSGVGINTSFDHDISDTNQIKAVVYNVGTWTVPGAVQTYIWDILVEANNTPPVIELNTSLSDPFSSATQDQDLRIYLNVYDKDQSAVNAADFAVQFTINGILLNGLNSYPFSASVTTPDCNHLFGDPIVNKYMCIIRIPSYGNNGSINGPTTLYQIQSSVTDSTGQLSNILSWDVYPYEYSTPPTLYVPGIIDGGLGPAAADSSYLYTTAGPVNNVDEGDTVNGIFYIGDAQRDDYDVVFQYQEDATGNYITLATTSVKRINSNEYVQSSVLSTIPLPQSTVESFSFGGPFTKNVNFRVMITDYPDTLPSQTYIYTWKNISVNDIDPEPVYTVGGEIPDPAATYNVFEGFPLTFNPIGAVTDASEAGSVGSNILYQWQFSSDALGFGTYSNIARATLKELSWTGDTLSGAHSDGEQFNFQFCIGDDGYQNPPDCLGSSLAYSWALSGSVTLRPAWHELPSLGGTIPEDTAVWAESSGGNVIKYSAVITGNQIQVTKTVYDAVTAVATIHPIIGNFNSDLFGGEVPRDLSMTGLSSGGNDYLYLAYIIDEADYFVPPTPVLRVLRVNRNDLGAAGVYDNNGDIVVKDISKIASDGNSAFVAYVDAGNDYRVDLLQVDPLARSISSISPQKSDFVEMGYLLGSGANVLIKHMDLERYDLYPTGGGHIDDIFMGATMSDIHMTHGYASNNIFIGGKNETNGSLDIITLYPGYVAPLGLGDEYYSFPLGVPQSSDVYFTGQTPKGVVFADFDNDGYDGLAVANSFDGTVTIWVNSKGLITTSRTFTTSPGDTEIASGDFNGDGYDDLAVLNPTDRTLKVLFIKNQGILDSTVTYTVGNKAMDLVAMDANNDTFIDLLYVCADDDTATIRINNGLGVFTNSQVITTADYPTSLAVGDFDGDGINELAVANYEDETITLYNNNPISVFNLTADATILPDYAPTMLRAARFNTDAYADLVVSHADDDTLSMYLKNANINLSDWGTAITRPTDQGPTGLIVGNFSGDTDNIDDAMVLNTLEIPNTIQIFNATGTDFSTPHNVATGNNLYMLAKGDFNNDGYPDSMVASESDNVLSVMINNAAVIQLANSDQSSWMTGPDEANRELFIATVKNDGDAYLSKISGNNSTPIQSTPMINPIGALCRADAGKKQVDLFYIQDMTVGSDGANAGENTKDVAIFQFLGKTAGEPNGVGYTTVINIENVPNMVGGTTFFQ